MFDKEIEFFGSQGLQYVSILGRGGYGTIYLVYSSQYKMNFAMKKIPVRYFKEEEIKSMINIDSPRIVRLYNYYKLDQFVYLLMEYCPTDLLHVISKKMSHKQLFQYIYEMILCVEACHENNIAHNDIKPSNFLVDKYGHVKISDFGLSSIYKENPESYDRKGTLPFMAPEMFGSAPYNPFLSDIWSLGVSIYGITTGKFPFMGKNDFDLIRKIYSGKYNEEILPCPQLAELIVSCIVVDPRKRLSFDEIWRLPIFSDHFKCFKSRSLANFSTLKLQKDIIVKPFHNSHKLISVFHQQKRLSC